MIDKAQIKGVLTTVSIEGQYLIVQDSSGSKYSISFPNIDGDVAIPSGTGQATIKEKAVTFAKMQDVEGLSIPARLASSPGPLSGFSIGKELINGQRIGQNIPLVEVPGDLCQYMAEHYFTRYVFLSKTVQSPEICLLAQEQDEGKEIYFGNFSTQVVNVSVSSSPFFIGEGAKTSFDPNTFIIAKVVNDDGNLVFKILEAGTLPPPSVE